MVSQTKDFTVAVVGGGMVGLTCAYGLVKASIPVDVYESAPKFEEVGAGIGLGPNALKALDGLGLLQTILAKVGGPKPSFRGFRLVSGEGEQALILDSIDYLANNSYGLGIYRPTYLDAVASLLPSDIIHFNKRCVCIDNSNARSVLHFSDGSSCEADLVIGADGIKSIIRSLLINNDVDHLVYTNTVAYRSLIPTDTLVSAGVQLDITGRPIFFVGKNKHIIVFPINSGKLINVVMFSANYEIPMGAPRSSSVQEVMEEELSKLQGWTGDARIIANHMNDICKLKWNIHALNPPLRSYVCGRIALIGDSAHGMLPHLGAGAGQGFEDANVLCKLLSHPRTMKGNLETVLKAYDAIRRPRANAVVDMSLAAGKLYDSYDKPNFATIPDVVPALWARVWDHDIENDLQAALEYFQSHASGSDVS